MLKSILKKSLGPPANTNTVSVSREDRNREIALQHAHLIQHRKDAEAQILNSIENLLDFPQTPQSNPAHPSPDDATRVKQLLRPFRPSDYDSLVEERNIDGKCGYVLCPRPHKHENAKYRILRGRGRGEDAFRVVEKKTLETWCSEACGNRALYLRVQLSEVPSWERSLSTSGDLVLYEERGNPSSESRTSGHLVEGTPDGASIVDGMEQLAIERGDQNRSGKAENLITSNIHEHQIQETSPTTGDTSTQAPDHHLSIEGFTSRFKQLNMRRSSGAESEDEDFDIF